MDAQRHGKEANWRPLMIIRSKLLRGLLFVANTRPPLFFDDFWIIKEKLLQRYATKGGIKIQFIHRDCWNCEGTGVFGLREDNDERCRTCDGTGIYSKKWVKHQSWKWGKHSFLTVIESSSSPFVEGDKSVPVDINGKVSKTPHWASTEAFLWLLLFCEPSKFFKFFTTRATSCNLPLSQLQRYVFWLKHLPSEIDRRSWRFRRWLYRPPVSNYLIEGDEIWDELPF